MLCQYILDLDDSRTSDVIMNAAFGVAENKQHVNQPVERNERSQQEPTDPVAKYDTVDESRQPAVHGDHADAEYQLANCLSACGDQVPLATRGKKEKTIIRVGSKRSCMPSSGNSITPMAAAAKMATRPRAKAAIM